VAAPHTIFVTDDLVAGLRVRRSTIRREIKAGRLRVSKRAGRYYFRAEWVDDWIAAGEVCPRAPRAAAEPTSADYQPPGRPPGEAA
jgi:hypothetical protein